MVSTIIKYFRFAARMPPSSCVAWAGPLPTSFFEPAADATALDCRLRCRSPRTQAQALPEMRTYTALPALVITLVPSQNSWRVPLQECMFLRRQLP